MNEVVVEVLAGLLHAFAGLDEGGEVKNGVEGVVSQGGPKLGSVAQVGLNEGRRLGHCRAVTGDERVVNGDPVPCLQQAIGCS